VDAPSLECDCYEETLSSLCFLFYEVVSKQCFDVYDRLFIDR
jgi:hypothetical protein